MRNEEMTDMNNFMLGLLSLFLLPGFLIVLVVVLVWNIVSMLGRATKELLVEGRRPRR